MVGLYHGHHRTAWVLSSSEQAGFIELALSQDLKLPQIFV